MTDLTFAILKYGFLLGLWFFVWLTVRALNRDVTSLAPRRSQQRAARERDRERASATAASAALSAEPQRVAVGAQGPVIVPSTSPHTPEDFTQPAQVQPAQHANHRSPAMLTIMDGPLSGTTMPLSQGTITLGRAANNTLVLDDEFVSSHHARVFLDDASGQWAVEDLHSTNGTKVADQPIHAVCLLSPGVPVRIGATTFELR
ncbi:hypothetical protein B9G54_03485 [Alloscardovia macacae]|uniref:FHA domain-containing protein n=1 Tax=Alloscardovia macacae TaxID=1160091 RepID=A0A1Y2SYC9_9BIFI|nr:FHA domain-containing protein [Alloscardovia macacae]OTA26854.1 hypothetical protein B9G54_03485 [Alloscardovia macacae]OTA29121.1 hypothetical protein B9T39_04360 [Alloscardovia macacae]